MTVMKGWVTWLSVAGLFLLAIADLIIGDTQAATEKIVAAIGLFGIGRKFEKRRK